MDLLHVVDHLRVRYTIAQEKAEKEEAFVITNGVVRVRINCYGDHEILLIRTTYEAMSVLASRQVSFDFHTS
jgi:hypothetical protein